VAKQGMETSSKYTAVSCLLSLTCCRAADLSLPLQAGTYFWHAHAGTLMMSGLVGQLVVRQPPGNDSQQGVYDDDSLPALIVQDWWRDPLVGWGRGSEAAEMPWRNYQFWSQVHRTATHMLRQLIVRGLYNTAWQRHIRPAVTMCLLRHSAGHGQGAPGLSRL
jgi:FtsP/CotA-like multicopper oxidase with cupredoxin domain